MRFKCGGKAGPDFTWNPGTAAQEWLEVHRGAFSVFDDLQLQRALDTRAAASCIPTRVSNAIARGTAAAKSATDQAVAMPS